MVALLAVGLAGAAPPASADEIRDRQWHLDFLDIAEAHRITQGQGVTVAVIDTGVQPDHPDLDGSVLSGYDIDTGGKGWNDEDGHGTQVANVIAGHGHGNGAGILGIAPEAEILPVSVGGTTANPSQIAEGVRWAVDHGARVINMSIEAVGRDQDLVEAVTYAQREDIVIVASAGNVDDDFVVGPPASYPGVIAASAINKSGRFAPNVSVAGEEIGVAAPGKDIASGGPTGYGYGTGTSASAAIVSGVAALVRTRYPDLDAVNVINRIVQTADDKGPPGEDPQYGFGVVNPVRALTADVPEVSENPLGALGRPPVEFSPPEVSPTAAAAPGDGNATNLPLLIAAIAIAVIALAVVAVFAAVVLRRRRPAGPPTHSPPYGPRHHGE